MEAMVGEGKVEISKMNGMDIEYEDETFDFCYCNPPFLDQETYSEEPEEIGRKVEKEFFDNIFMMQKENNRVIKKGGLIVIVMNDQRKEGNIIPLHSKLIEVSKEAGLVLHDIVVAEVMSQQIRLRKKAFELKRTVKCHEYVMVFKNNGEN